MSNQAESYVFEDATDKKTNPKAFISEKYYLDINDQNNKNYKNQQLIFDCPSLSIQDGYVSLAESILRIPMQTTISSNKDLITTYKENLVSLKGNATSLIDSIQIMLDNKVLKTFSSHSEVPCYFKLLSSMTKDYEQTVAKGDLNHSLDDGVMSYDDKIGEKMTSNNAIQKKADSLVLLTDTAFQKSKNIINKFKSHCKVESTKMYTYNYLVEIPLKFMDELFEKIPLAKGLYLKMHLQLHTGSCSFTSTGKVITAVSSNTTYGVLPHYINPSALGETNGVLAGADAGIVTIDTQVLRNSLSGKDNPLLGTCQLHAAVYKFTNDKAQVLSNRPRVKIDYNQQMYQTYKNAEPGQQFNFQISSSTSRSSFLLIHTRLSDKINMSDAASDATFKDGNTAGAISTMNSPFTPSPFTTKAYSSLTNFQINLSGTPMFTRGALSFDYDIYNDNFKSFNSANGQLDVSDSSGVISREQWEKNYGFIVVDLRKYELYANWLQPKNISVSGYNNSPNFVDYMFFLMEEKDITLDVETGKIVVE